MIIKIKVDGKGTIKPIEYSGGNAIYEETDNKIVTKKIYFLGVLVYTKVSFDNIKINQDNSVEDKKVGF